MGPLHQRVPAATRGTTPFHLCIQRGAEKPCPRTLDPEGRAFPAFPAVPPGRTRHAAIFTSPACGLGPRRANQGRRAERLSREADQR